MGWGEVRRRGEVSNSGAWWKWGINGGEVKVKWT